MWLRPSSKPRKGSFLGALARLLYLLTGCIAYDEEDDGFAFTRTRSKRAKAEPMLASSAEEERQEERAESARTRKPRKKSVSSPTAEPMRPEGWTGKRRSARHSGDHENADPSVLRVKKRRKDRSPSVPKSDQGSGKRCGDHNRTEQDSRQDHSHSVEYTFDVTKIALPFADTPIIRRNKEMRKTNGSRRSSLGMRGRRASSLIDTGRSDGIRYLAAELILLLTTTQLYPTTRSKAPNSTST